MKKLQLLIWAPEGLAIEGFSRLVREELVPRVLAGRPNRLKLTLTSETPSRASIIPFRRRGLALLSIWVEGAEGLEEWLSRIGATGELIGGYRVRETAPCEYERDWPDGRATPGSGLLTLLRRKPGLGDDEFFTRWFDGHTPLTLRVHPVWCYIRNVVETSSVGSPHFDGIVEEHFRSRAHLANPALFFGGPLDGERHGGIDGLRMIPNMARVAVDIAGFLDLTTLETYLVEERWILS